MLTVPEIAARVRAVVERQPLVNAVYLFGSQAAGEARPDSDVDLGVLFFQRSTLNQRVDLELLLSDALDRRVDLVDLGQCGAYLALEAIRGERIYGADPVLCDEFDLSVMRRAADLAPFERERRRMLLDPATVRSGVRP